MLCQERREPIGPRLKTVLQEALATHGHALTVFVKDTGKPWTPNALTKAFTAACQRAGIEPLSPHVLRHTFASRLVMAGVDLPTVQELMGHKHIAMTLRYAHLSPSHKRVAIETLESHFSGKSPADFHNTPVSTPSLSGVKVVALR